MPGVDEEAQMRLACCSIGARTLGTSPHILLYDIECIILCESRTEYCTTSVASQSTLIGSKTKHPFQCSNVHLETCTQNKAQLAGILGEMGLHSLQQAHNMHA